MDHPTIYGEPLSFEQIGIRLGITRHQAETAYRSGISKLRRNSTIGRNMRGLVAGLHQSPVLDTNEVLD